MLSQEDRHALKELLGGENGVEVDRVRRHVHVSAERRQVSAETLRLGVGRQRTDLHPATAQQRCK